MYYRARAQLLINLKQVQNCLTKRVLNGKIYHILVALYTDIIGAPKWTVGAPVVYLTAKM